MERIMFGRRNFLGTILAATVLPWIPKQKSNQNDVVPVLLTDEYLISKEQLKYRKQIEDLNIAYSGIFLHDNGFISDETLLDSF